MKTTIFPVLFFSLFLQLTARADLVFLVGVDQAASPFQAEFEQENGLPIDDDYYYEDGDYTGLTATSGNWTGGQEILKNGDNADELGMPRAITTGATTFYIHFQLTPEEVAMNSLLFRTELVSVKATTTSEVTFYMNNQPLFVQPAVGPVGQAQVPVNILFSPATGNAVAGSNFITVSRTGGDDAGTGSAWMQFDFHELQAIPEPSTASLLLIGISLMIALRKMFR
jgi:hypothetical protein